MFAIQFLKGFFQATDLNFVQRPFGLDGSQVFLFLFCGIQFQLQPLPLFESIYDRCEFIDVELQLCPLGNQF